MTTGSKQESAGSAAKATQGAEAAHDYPWAEASIWTERMLSALVNGVKGGKWYSLMDKVCAPKTLAVAWTRVRSNKGAAGVDGQSTGRFEAGRRDACRKSFERLKEKIRDKTRRTRGESLERVIVDLNRTLRGWFGYFKHARSRTFRVLDMFTRRRLRALLRKQEKRPGLGICRADHRRWSKAFFADAGLFALHTAWQTARQFR